MSLFLISIANSLMTLNAVLLLSGIKPINLRELYCITKVKCKVKMLSMIYGFLCSAISFVIILSNVALASLIRSLSIYQMNI